MATTAPIVNRAAEVSQPIDSLDALLKTKNVFLFIPNIIGEFLRGDETLARCSPFPRLCTRVSLGRVLLLHADASEIDHLLLFDQPVSRRIRRTRGSSPWSK